MTQPDEMLIFSEEPATSETVEPASNPPLYVLVVDDEPMMHAVTAMVLDGLLCNTRPVGLLHAYSASEARKIMRTCGDIALILLDVVMETESAGLDLVKDVREGLLNSAVRVVLRSGQPGVGFDSGYLQRYDISSYCAKTELTRQQLIGTVLDALLSYCRLSTIKYQNGQQALKSGEIMGKLPVTG